MLIDAVLPEQGLVIGRNTGDAMGEAPIVMEVTRLYDAAGEDTEDWDDACICTARVVGHDVLVNLDPRP